MRSKTWAIALALLSRLTVGDCLGPPLHRSFPAAAERARDPDGEIDAVYRMREELARQNLLRHHLKSPVENGISATEVEYVDDETEPRHRYYGNKLRARPHTPTEEKTPEMTKSSFRQGSPPSRSALQGSSRDPTTHQGHRPPHGKPGNMDQVIVDEGREGGVQPEEIEPERPGEEQLIRTAPYVHIRSGVESFQPIAAAIAMQENLNSLAQEEDNETPPLGPRLPPIHVSTSAKNPSDVVHSEPSSLPNGNHVDSTAKHNDVLHHQDVDGLEKAVAGEELQAALLQAKAKEETETASLTEVYFLAVVAGCSIAGFMGLVLAGVCYYRLRKKAKATSDVEYPAYGVTGPIKDRDNGAPGDRKLAQSAQMYHYQHQKQQMIASERLNSDVNHRGSDAESEEENEEGDYTVFECPGLATNGDMEVRNPLFSEQTPVTAPSDVPGAQGKK